MSLNHIVATGSYSGNDTSQTISIGWQPALVFINTSRSGGPAGQRGHCVKMPDMSGAEFLSNNSAAEYKTSQGITLTSTGFTVGNLPEVNRSGDTLYWTAIRQSPAVDWGSYTGDGEPLGQSIVTGRQPSAVFICQTTGTERYGAKTAVGMVSTSTEVFQGAVNTQGFTSQIDSDGFTVAGQLNLTSETYVWVALYDVVGSTRHFRTDSYVGDGSSPKTITLGVQPLALVDFSLNVEMGHKFTDMAGDDYGQLETNYKWVTTNGLTLISTGFQAGSLFNSNGVTYPYLAGVR